MVRLSWLFGAAIAVFVAVNWEKDLMFTDNAMHAVIRLTSSLEPMTVGTMWSLRYPQDAEAIQKKRMQNNIAYEWFDAIQVTPEAKRLESRTHVIKVPRSDGAGQIEVHVVKPEHEGNLATVVYVHGGGGVIGNAAGGGGIWQIASELEVVVASVEYRLAPEHPFPAAVNDCIDVVRYVAETGAVDFGGDVNRIGVFGVSMGGGIAAAVAAEAKELVKAQAMIVPVLMYGATTRSHIDFGTIPSLPAHAMLWMWQHYAPDALACIDDPRCSPLRRKDLLGLPAAVIMPGSADIARDEGVAYAQRLKAAGVSTDLLEMRSTHIGALARFDAAAFASFNEAFKKRLQ